MWVGDIKPAAGTYTSTRTHTKDTHDLHTKTRPSYGASDGVVVVCVASSIHTGYAGHEFERTQHAHGTQRTQIKTTLSTAGRKQRHKPAQARQPRQREKENLTHYIWQIKYTAVPQYILYVYTCIHYTHTQLQQLLSEHVSWRSQKLPIRSHYYNASFTQQAYRSLISRVPTRWRHGCN